MSNTKKYTYKTSLYRIKAARSFDIKDSPYYLIAKRYTDEQLENLTFDELANLLVQAERDYNRKKRRKNKKEMREYLK